MHNDILTSILVASGTLLLAILKYGIRRFKYKKLTKHYLFNELKAWERESYTLKFINEFKTKLGRDLWRIKLQVGYKHLYRWVDAFEKGLVSDLSSIFNVIEDIVKEYNKIWVQMGIFDEIRQTFNDYHNKNIQVLVNLINIELKSYFKSDREKVYEILNYFRAIYIIAKGDVQNVINFANGKLRDKVYKGIKNTNEFIKK